MSRRKTKQTTIYTATRNVFTGSVMLLKGDKITIEKPSATEAKLIANGALTLS